MIMQQVLTSKPSALPPVEELEAGTSLWRDAWHRLAKNKMAVASAIVLVVLSSAAALAPWLAP